MIVTATETRSRRAGLGVAAIIGSLVPAVWLLVVFAVASSGQNTAVADVLITASFVVLPIAVIAVLVLAIASLVVNNWLGRALAILALVLVLAQVIALVSAARAIL